MQETLDIAYSNVGISVSTTNTTQYQVTQSMGHLLHGIKTYT